MPKNVFKTPLYVGKLQVKTIPYRTTNINELVETIIEARRIHRVDWKKLNNNYTELYFTFTGAC